MLSYAQRAADMLAKSTGQADARRLGAQLLQLMERKRSNLCLSADGTRSADILRLAEQCGPFICMFKTHVDIIEDYSVEFARSLCQLADRYDFMLFEDRKFADIGHTVYLQYTGGVYQINEWSHITNCHPLPGDGIVDGLKLGATGCGGPYAAENRILAEYPRGLLLLAEMSSQGSMATGEYTLQTVEMAERHPDYVIGFVCGRRLHPDFIHFSPGVQLEPGRDKLGQQYRTPELVLTECLSDVIIVGRGIYRAADPARAAKEFQQRGWSAYESRLSAKLVTK